MVRDRLGLAQEGAEREAREDVPADRCVCLVTGGFVWSPVGMSGHILVGTALRKQLLCLFLHHLQAARATPCCQVVMQRSPWRGPVGGAEQEYTCGSRSSTSYSYAHGLTAFKVVALRKRALAAQGAHVVGLSGRDRLALVLDVRLRAAARKDGAAARPLLRLLARALHLARRVAHRHDDGRLVRAALAERLQHLGREEAARGPPGR